MEPMRRIAAPMLLAGVFAGCHGTVEHLTTLTIVPLGPVSDRSIAAVQASLARTYRLDVRVSPRQALPKRAYYPPRDRYRAERLNDWLAEKATTDKVLGLTAEDISTTARRYDDWGIAGLAQLGRRACVVSSFRLKGDLRRLGDVAVHETGHVLGRPHCSNLGCTMHDAEGKMRNVGQRLCPGCRRTLALWVRQ